MLKPDLSLSRRSWLKLARWTLFGTAGCWAISLFFNYFAFRDLGHDALVTGLISATVLPILLAGPLFFYLTLKLRELAIVNHKLGTLASTDSLTACLNRGAFSTFVEAYLETSGAGRRQPRGALLIIDADHFKTINDCFGHDQGDEALRVIVAAIREAVRGGDIVGRMGGEEFGVFLPEASAEIAGDVGVRIRMAVQQASFAPGGAPYRLAVSVGVAVFGKEIAFSELFRVADQRLYEAKMEGRNRVKVASLPPVASPSQARRALH